MSYSMNVQLKKQHIDDHLKIWDNYFHNVLNKKYTAVDLSKNRIAFNDFKFYSNNKIYWMEAKTEPSYEMMAVEALGSFQLPEYLNLPTGHRITVEDEENYAKCIDLCHQAVCLKYLKEMKGKTGLLLTNELSSNHYISHILKDKYYILKAIPAMTFIRNNYQSKECPFVITMSSGGSRTWSSLCVIFNPDDFPADVILYKGKLDEIKEPSIEDLMF